MPGTIRVSVAGLMDPPKADASTSHFTLNVAIGKKEYQSMGQGDCSVPLVSLRDNMTIVIRDVEGNEIFQTEFRTISVVEKGLLEDSYPLLSGGYIHMKLQFLLSHEEHMRIREVRESALKRKQGEQSQTENKDSVSGHINGNWTTYFITERALVDQPKQTDPDSSGLSDAVSVQVSEQSSEHSIKRDGGQLTEASREDLKIQPPLDGLDKYQILSEVGLDPQLGCSRSLVSGNATEHSYSDFAVLKENQSLSNVRKMVTAFESSVLQGPDPQFGPRIRSSLRKVAMEGSLKTVPSEESDIDKLKVPKTILKSFSAGILSDMNSQQNPKLFRSAFPKKKEEIDPATGWKQMEKGKAALESKNDEKLKSQDSAKPEAVKERMTTTKTVNSVRFTEHVEEGNIPVSIVFKKGPSPMSLKTDLKAAEENVNPSIISKYSKILDMQNVSGASDVMPSSCSGKELEARPKHNTETGLKHNTAGEGSLSSDRADDANGIIQQRVSETLQLPGNVKVEAMRIKEKEKEKCKEIQLSRKIPNESAIIDQPGTLNTYQQGSSLSTITKENESECSRIHLDEEITSSSPNDTVDLLTYFDHDGRPLGNHDVWISRRLCITTGTRQLRDLLDCCTNSGGTHPIEKNPSIRPGDERNGMQQKPDDNAPVQVNSVGITKSNGGLIEQGARIAIVAVACGTLLFNTRQRKPK